MAQKLASLPILFVFLLLAFSQVLGEHQVGSKDADVNQFNDDKHGGGYYHGGGGYGHGHGGGGHGCGYHCGHRCCSAAEYAEFVNKKATADGFGHHCHYFCHHKCCSAAEFAEFTKQAAGQH
ncbi:glycine-rich protein DC7.1-like isoform X1 [Nymphaea colorata]|nr:glycine-rich protein DC7.1-like isoform X1 [Nymphaea colorata]